MQFQKNSAHHSGTDKSALSPCSALLGEEVRQCGTHNVFSLCHRKCSVTWTVEKNSWISRPHQPPSGPAPSAFNVSTSVLCHNASSTESSRSVSVFPQRPPFPWIPILWILWSRHRHADWKWRIYLWQLSRLMTDKRLMSAACSGLSSSRALECKLCVSLRLSKWWKEVGWTLRWTWPSAGDNAVPVPLLDRGRGDPQPELTFLAWLSTGIWKHIWQNCRSCWGALEINLICVPTQWKTAYWSRWSKLIKSGR